MSYRLILLCFSVAIFISCCLQCRIVLPFVSNNSDGDDVCHAPNWKIPNCHSSNPNVTTIGVPSNEWWDYVREAYVKAVGEESSTIMFSNNREENARDGFLVPGIELRNSPLHGRGIFTKNAIKKGTKIWDNRYTARCNECQMKKFLSMLNENEACELLILGYPSGKYTNYEEYQFAVELDISAMMNDASDHANAVGIFDSHDPRRRSDTGGYGMYASRDIEANEEVLIHYKEFLEISLHPSLLWYHSTVLRSHNFDPYWIFLHLF